MFGFTIALIGVTTVALAAAWITWFSHRELLRSHEEVVGTLEVNTRVLNAVAGRDHIDSKLRGRVDAMIADNISVTTEARRKFNFDD